MWHFFDALLKAYGLAAVIILGLGFLLWKFEINSRKERKSIHSEHKTERDEWRKSDNNKFNTMIESSNKNTQVLEGLKTVIEARSLRRD